MGSVCVALGCYDGGSSFSGCYGGRGGLQHRYKGHRRISDRVERDCGQYNGAGCTLCQEKPPDWCSASKSGKFIILQISNDSVFNTSKYGYATLSDGSQPSWENYKGKYAFFMQYKKIATYIKNDTEGDDWIDYFPCG